MVEKLARSNGKNIFAWLPKTSSFVSFRNAPFSPGKDRRAQEKLKTAAGKGFSGPIVSIIPAEAIAKARDSSFHQQEPTSPKVSCIGQIKKNKKLGKAKAQREEKVPKPEKKAFKIKRLFRNGRKVGSDAEKSERRPPVPLPPAVPGLGQMKRFSSGREAFANFDWKAQRDVSSCRIYFSDEEREEGEEEEEEEKVVIPFSCPIMVGGGEIASEPRKEVNLWKRRTVAPPMLLQLNHLDKTR